MKVRQRTSEQAAVKMDPRTHVHDENASLVELVDHLLWWYPDGRHEQTRLFFDDNVYQLGQLSMRVIVLNQKKRQSAKNPNSV
jgi:hypothetical protein